MSYNKTIWEKALSVLENTYTDKGMRTTYNAYLKTLKPETEYKGVLYLRTLGDEHKNMIGQRFAPEIEGALTRASLELTGETRDWQICAYPPEEMDKFLASIPSGFTKSSSISLNPNYTFDTFIVGNSNKVAYSASRNICEKPGLTFNPLFIYGGVGLGKTHLMHAIGNQLLKINPNLKILYITSEAFISEFVDSIRNKSQDSFKSKFRSVDILMIDDIQFIAKGDTSQEELFHTFNYLWQNNKQLVFTSDRTPQEIPNLSDRLCSRFISGGPIQIAKPDYETRVAILRDKVKYISQKFDYFADVDEDVLYYIAEKDETNIRELEGALKSLFAYAKMFANNNEEMITMDVARAALSSFIIEPKEKVITPELIIKTVCSYFDITSEDFMSKKKNKDIAYPRQIVMYLIHSMCSVTYVRIAEITGRKDHTTVMHAVKKLDEMIKADPSVKATIDDIKHKIKE